MSFILFNRVCHSYSFSSVPLLFKLGTIVAAVMLGLAWSHSALAATRPVTNTLDNSAGSLRAQIAAAAPNDTITFSVTGVITITSGQMDIAKNLTISGPGADVLAINGNNASGIFIVEPGYAVQISDLAIKNGRNPFGTDSGGVQSYGALTLFNTTFISNTGYYGAAVYSSGALTLSNSSFISNTSRAQGGALFINGRASLADTSFGSNTVIGQSSQGGAIYVNTGALNVTNGTFISNTAGGDGGAIAAFAPTTLISSSLTGNDGGYYGGAIVITSTLQLISSTLTRNSASNAAGGIWINTGVVTLTGSTLVSNTSTNYGGGIDMYTGTLTIYSSTFTGNSSNVGGMVDADNGTLTIVNSTVTGNHSPNGGAVYSVANLLIDNTTFTGNSSGAEGGALYNIGIGVVNDSLFVNNSALPYGEGGAIENNGSLTVNDCTFVGNSGTGGGAIDNNGPLIANKIIPRPMAIHVRSIQTNSSPGSHFQEEALTSSHLEIAQMALVEFLEWYYTTHPSHAAVPPPAVPPLPAPAPKPFPIGKLLAGLAALFVIMAGAISSMNGHS